MNPNPPPSPRRERRRPRGQRKPTTAGNLKIVMRTVGDNFNKPLTIWSDKRHRGDFDREYRQLLAAKARIDNNPRYGKVEWAAIYNCPGNTDRGAKVAEFFLDRNEWVSTGLA